MTIGNNIRNETIQYDINREEEKISALSSVKCDKYEYLTIEDILASDQSTMIGQAKFTYSPLELNLEKQIKIIKVQRRK